MSVYKTNGPLLIISNLNHDAKFGIYKGEGLYYLKSKNKDPDQLRDAKLICVFVFTYAYCWFSHEAAHLI